MPLRDDMGTRLTRYPSKIEQSNKGFRKMKGAAQQLKPWIDWQSWALLMKISFWTSHSAVEVQAGPFGLTFYYKEEGR